jgi:hypothetical protein
MTKTASLVAFAAALSLAGTAAGQTKPKALTGVDAGRPHLVNKASLHPDGVIEIPGLGTVVVIGVLLSPRGPGSNDDGVTSMVARIHVDTSSSDDANPYMGALTPAKSGRALVASAINAKNFVDAIPMGKEVDIEVSLEPSKGAGKARAVRVARFSSAERSPEFAEPGMDLYVRPSVAQRRSIDEKDPYSQ